MAPRHALLVLTSNTGWLLLRHSPAPSWRHAARDAAYTTLTLRSCRVRPLPMRIRGSGSLATKSCSRGILQFVIVPKHAVIDVGFQYRCNNSGLKSCSNQPSDLGMCCSCGQLYTL